MAMGTVPAAPLAPVRRWARSRIIALAVLSSAAPAAAWSQEPAELTLRVIPLSISVGIGFITLSGVVVLTG